LISIISLNKNISNFLIEASSALYHDMEDMMETDEAGWNPLIEGSDIISDKVIHTDFFNSIFSFDFFKKYFA